MFILSNTENKNLLIMQNITFFSNKKLYLLKKKSHLHKSDTTTNNLHTTYYIFYIQEKSHIAHDIHCLCAFHTVNLFAESNKDNSLIN